MSAEDLRGRSPMSPDAAPPAMTGDCPAPASAARATPDCDDFRRLVSLLLTAFVGSILAGVVAGLAAAAVDHRRSLSDQPPPAIRLGGAWTASRLSPGDGR